MLDLINCMEGPDPSRVHSTRLDNTGKNAITKAPWEFKKGEHYKILNNKKSKEKNNDVVETVILFAPREWRGYRNSSIPFSKHDTLSPKALADEINNYPPGTVTHIYTTSDGGFHLNQLNELNTYLEEHVSVVNPNELVFRKTKPKNSIFSHSTDLQSSRLP